jgi:pimeloyl-ACP methyl ester carboxylesterase
MTADPLPRTHTTTRNSSRATRGWSGSAPAGRRRSTGSGYDKATLAAHIRGLAQTLDLEQPYIAGHDLGSHVTYACVRRFADTVR